MRRLLGSALVALLSALVLSLPARAELVWCETDPIVSLNGTVVQILVAIPQDYLPLVNGPTAVTIRAPGNVAGALVFTDAGFNGYGEVVAWGTSGSINASKEFPVEIDVSVPVDASRLAAGTVVPVAVTILPDNAALLHASGTSIDTEVKFTVAGR